MSFIYIYIYIYNLRSQELSSGTSFSRSLARVAQGSPSRLPQESSPLYSSTPLKPNRGAMEMRGEQQMGLSNVTQAFRSPGYGHVRVSSNSPNNP